MRKKRVVNIPKTIDAPKISPRMEERMSRDVKYGSDGKGQINPILTISNNENRDSWIIRRDGPRMTVRTLIPNFKIIMSYPKIFFRKVPYLLFSFGGMTTFDSHSGYFSIENCFDWLN